MSTVPFPGVSRFSLSDAAGQHLAALGEAPEMPVRRRARAEQARAIEALGHAVDHLIYSRMFLTDKAEVRGDADAVHLLMTVRRSVFEECERVVSGDRQMRSWILEWLWRRTH
jgi:hypothetical protein